ncbi:hypothetical protein [Qipengyuania sp.]|uniref:hypothetical protein n=1 Tax=Qipengyuania sp. TaxID=2004515 RepID=UPI003515E1AD
MDAALLKRLREAPAVAAKCGTFNDEPAIDFDERKSDEQSAFPAAIITLIDPGKRYDQDGPSGKRQARWRFECMALTPDGAAELAEAIEGELETEATVATVRFQQGFLAFGRSFPPETVGELRIYRRLIDMDITATY